MKFITSTHLKQWADTKECQSLLPELVRRLICASVKQLDRLSFPSGDAVHMPGWDGIVSPPGTDRYGSWGRISLGMWSEQRYSN